MLVELKGVTHFFGYRLIFKDVSLSFEPGKIYLICGNNGSGKSTLLKIIAGILKPSKGEVIQHLPKTKIGYLGHSPGLYEYFSAWENLRFFAKIYGLKAETKEIEQILERVGLRAFKHEKVKNFSRGMKQRLNLARLFLLEPDLFLLDEPETGLDQSFSKVLEKYVCAQVKQRQKSVIWISHLVESKDFAYCRLMVQDKKVSLV